VGFAAAAARETPVLRAADLEPRHAEEVTPFMWTVVIFLADFGGLAVSLHPKI